MAGVNVADPNYSVDPDLAIGMHGHRVVRGEVPRQPGRLRELVLGALAKV